MGFAPSSVGTRPASFLLDLRPASPPESAAAASATSYGFASAVNPTGTRSTMAAHFPRERLGSSVPAVLAAAGGFTRFRWQWDGFPDEASSTPEPTPPRPSP